MKKILSIITVIFFLLPFGFVNAQFCTASPCPPGSVEGGVMNCTGEGQISCVSDPNNTGGSGSECDDVYCVGDGSINRDNGSGVNGNPQNTGGYTLLESLPTLPGYSQPGSSQSPDLETYVDGVYTLAIGLAGVLAVVMIVIGGIEYIFSAIPSAKSDAKNRIVSAVGGLILTLTAWIILNTINPALIENNFDLDPIGSGDAFENFDTHYCAQDLNALGFGSGEKCFSTEQECEDSIWEVNRLINSCEERDGPLDSEPIPSDVEGSFQEREQAIRDRLEDANVEIYSSGGGGPCSSPTADGIQGKCTNVYGFDQTGMTDNIINFKNACDGEQGSCDLVITGGTEGGHETHAINMPIVDFRSQGTNNVNSFIRSGDPFVYKGNQYYRKSGISCWLETPGTPNEHWHCRSDI